MAYPKVYCYEISVPFDANASFWHVFLAFWMQCCILKEMWGILCVHFLRILC